MSKEIEQDDSTASLQLTAYSLQQLNNSRLYIYFMKGGLNMTSYYEVFEDRIMSQIMWDNKYRKVDTKEWKAIERDIRKNNYLTIAKERRLIELIECHKEDSEVLGYDKF